MNSRALMTIPTTLVPTRYGYMHVIDQDKWVSRALRELGEHSEGEVNTIRQVLAQLRPGPEGFIIVDAGAYIGDMTLPFSQMAAHVYAFEPQPAVREILNANLEVNSCTNVTVLPYALGHECKTISFSQTDESRESPGSQNFLLEPDGDTRVEMRTLDSLDINPTIIKADVEGMEYLLLAGAQKTIARCRPFLFLEVDTVTTPGTPPWERVMQELGYVGYRVQTPFWVPNNFNHVPSDPFEGTVSFMLLGVPLVPAIRIAYAPSEAT